MSESLWGAEEILTPVKKHKVRKTQPMAAVQPAAAPVETTRPAFGSRAPQRDFAMEFAIRNLGNAGMLRPEDYQANLHIIRPALDPEVQAATADWKARNGLA